MNWIVTNERVSERISEKKLYKIVSKKKEKLRDWTFIETLWVAGINYRRLHKR
jgi:hypothetical protein